MRLKRLPRSVTGIFARGEPRPSVDPRRFRGACHLVAQMEGGSVEDFCSDLFLRSYYSARLNTRAESVTVLCNAVYPYVAFAPAQREEPTWRDRTFVTPMVQATFDALTDVVLLDADWLMSNITQDLLTELPPWESKRVRHWEPERIGAVVFNEWD